MKRAAFSFRIRAAALLAGLSVSAFAAGSRASVFSVLRAAFPLAISGKLAMLALRVELSG